MYKKGKAKTGGRKKGSVNKTTAVLKEKITTLVNDLYPKVIEDLEKLEPEERVAAFVKLLPYVMPKAVQKIELTGEEGEPVIRLVRFEEKKKK
jgi:hypothetical protein